ncbi:MAG: cobalamin-dependent protein [Candidatus Woesearchaeota archaeon]|nr:cobalamin-dependent protein [Candidatus Woesearchaeota archaeon]
MTKKIMLIKPPVETDAVFDPIRTTQPIGSWYIASYLKERGYDVNIFDTVIEGISQRVMVNSSLSYEDFQKQKATDLQTMAAGQFVEKYSPQILEGGVSRQVVRTGLSNEKILDRIRKENPEYIGLSIFASCNHGSAIKIAKLIKSEFPEIKIVAGGAHATDMAEKVLQDSEGAISFCVKGDGQFVLEEIIEGKTPETGVAYMENGRLVNKGEYRRMRMDEFSTLDPTLLENIVLPMPATHTQDTQGRKYVDVMFSRGCKKKCEYCVAGSKNYGYDPLSLDKVDKQLKSLKQAGYEELVVQDDDLLRNKEYFFEVLKLINKYDFKWQDNGGIAIEDLDVKVADAIIENGNCNSLYVPFNPRNYKVKQAANSATKTYSGNVEQLKRLREAGIYIYTSGIYGTDVQTKEDIDGEINIYKNLIQDGFVDQALVFAVSHLPGTRNHQLFSQDIVDHQDWIGYSIFVPHAKTSSMSIREVETAVVKANQEFNRIQEIAGPWGSSFPK